MKKIILIFIFLVPTVMANSNSCREISLFYIDHSKESVLTLAMGKKLFQDFVNPCPSKIKRGLALLDRYKIVKNNPQRREPIVKELEEVYKAVGHVQFALMAKEKAQGRLLKLLEQNNKDHNDKEENNFFTSIGIVFYGLAKNAPAEYNQLTDYILEQYRQNVAIYDFVPPLMEWIEQNTARYFESDPHNNIASAFANGIITAYTVIHIFRGLNRLRKGDLSLFAFFRQRIRGIKEKIKKTPTSSSLAGTSTSPPKNPFWGMSHRERRIRDWSMALTTGAVYGGNNYRQNHLIEKAIPPRKKLELVHERVLAEMVLANRELYQESEQNNHSSYFSYFRANIPTIEERKEVLQKLSENGVNKTLNSTITTTREYSRGSQTLPKGSKIELAGVLANLNRWYEIEEAQKRERRKRGESLVVDTLLEICTLEDEDVRGVWHEKDSSYFIKKIETLERFERLLKRKFVDKEQYPITVTARDVRLSIDGEHKCSIEEGRMFGLNTVYNKLQKMTTRLRDNSYDRVVREASLLSCSLQENEFILGPSTRESIKKTNDLLVYLSNFSDIPFRPVIVHQDHCDKKVGDELEHHSILFSSLYQQRERIKEAILTIGTTKICKITNLANGVAEETSGQTQQSFSSDIIINTVVPLMNLISTVIDPRLVKNENGEIEHLDWFSPLRYAPPEGSQCGVFKFAGMTEVINLDILFQALNRFLDQVKAQLQVSFSFTIPKLAVSMNGDYEILQRYHQRQKLDQYEKATREGAKMVCKLEKNGGEIDGDSSNIKKIIDLIITIGTLKDELGYLPILVEEEHCLEEGEVIEIESTYQNLVEWMEIIKNNIFSKGIESICPLNELYSDITSDESMAVGEKIDIFYQLTLNEIYPTMNMIEAILDYRLIYTVDNESFHPYLDSTLVAPKCEEYSPFGAKEQINLLDLQNEFTGYLEDVKLYLNELESTNGDSITEQDREKVENFSKIISPFLS